MKKLCVIFILVALTMSCKEKIVYEQDPRLFNDAFHGHIVGKVLQKNSSAMVVVSQEKEIASVLINPDDGVFRFEDLEIGNYDLTIQADNYRKYILKNVQVEGAGTRYLGDIDLSKVPDLIMSYYPEDDAEIVYNNNFYGLSISMQFTQAMDRESVEEAFSTEPETEGIFMWGQYAWDQSRYYFGWDDELAYRGSYDPGATITTYSRISSFTYRVAQKDCYVDTTYRVKLSTAAMDTAGNHLRFPLEYSFSTIQSSSTLNGIQTSPSHGDINVDLVSNSGIQLTFPRNMDAASTEAAITIHPQMDHIFIWPGYNQLTIYTGGSLYADTTYTIEIDATAEDLDGIQMGHDYEFSFETADIGLRSTWPRNGQLFIDLNADITMYFNTYMVRSSVQNLFRIEPAISGNLQWGTSHSTNDKTALTFFPYGSFQPNTKYTVTIDPGVEDLFGSKMKEGYSFSFITRPE